MGQYWLPVNLDKKEFIQPHKLASGLKLWEILANNHVGQALVILTAAHKEHRGGGDFDLDENWHGPERTFPEHNTSPGPMPRAYPQIAKETIGRWAGDRIAIVGDYAEDTDLPAEFEASKIYGRCPYDEEEKDGRRDLYRDITDDVCKVIEHEMNGTFTGTGWREFKYNKEK